MAEAPVKPSERRINDPVTTTSSTSASCWANVGVVRGSREKETAAHSKLRLYGILRRIMLSIVMIIFTFIIVINTAITKC
jgi:hypothetical protein